MDDRNALPQRPNLSGRNRLVFDSEPHPHAPVASAAAPALLSHRARNPDIVIVGGGLVGSVLGLCLARHRIPCTILERDTAVPDVLRGELIMPAGVDVLRDLHVLAPLSNVTRPTRGVSLHHPAFGTGEIQVDYDAAPCPLHLPEDSWAPAAICGWRKDIYETLRTLVRAEPTIDVRTGVEVRDIARCPNGGPNRRHALRLADGESVQADLVVAADGFNSRLRSRMGFEPIDDRSDSVVQGFIGLAPEYERTHVHVGAHPLGAVFVFPFPDGRVRCTIEYNADYRHEVRGADPMRAHLEILKAALPHIYEELGGDSIEIISKLHVQRPRTTTLASVVEDGFALVGDAAGTLDPFTGFGMAMGLQDAAALAAVLAAAEGDVSARTLRHYERDRARRWRWRFEATELLAYLFLAKAEGFADSLARKVGTRWADREWIVPLLALQFAGYDPLIEPSFGLRHHIYGLL